MWMHKIVDIMKMFKVDLFLFDIIIVTKLSLNWLISFENQTTKHNLEHNHQNNIRKCVTYDVRNFNQVSILIHLV